MATRSRIGIASTDANGNVTVQSIYCHWDGYPEHNGQILMDHYRDRDKVMSLIKLGSISILASEVNPTGPHSFDNPQKGVVVAYHRDRGEMLSQCTNYSIDSFVKSDVEEYGYLFTEDGEWHFINGHKNPETREMVPLSYVLSEIEKS